MDPDELTVYFKICFLNTVNAIFLTLSLLFLRAFLETDLNMLTFYFEIYFLKAVNNTFFALRLPNIHTFKEISLSWPTFISKFTT